MFSINKNWDDVIICFKSKHYDKKFGNLASHMASYERLVVYPPANVDFFLLLDTKVCPGISYWNNLKMENDRFRKIKKCWGKISILPKHFLFRWENQDDGSQGSFLQCHMKIVPIIWWDPFQSEVSNPNFPLEISQIWFQQTFQFLFWIRINIFFGNLLMFHGTECVFYSQCSWIIPVIVTMNVFCSRFPI